MTVWTMAGWVAQEVTARPNLWSLLIQGGVIGLVSSTFALLHKSVVAAYREIIVKQEKIADVERQRADAANEQLMQLLRPIKEAGNSL